MGARALVIGLDGLDLGLVEELGAGALPHLHAVMEGGTYAALESVQPPATLPNWTTFLTGVDPGRHGVFDFTLRQGYRVRFTGGTVRETPTVFQRLDRLGLRTACLSFPATWPPEQLAHGAFVSGWDAPVAFEANRSFMWPTSLFDETVREFGVPTFDDVDEFRADAAGWVDRLPEALSQRVARKQRWATWMLRRRRWDLFAVYFGESDTASHYLWAHHDACSPRRPREVTQTQQEGLSRVYRALDDAVGNLIGEAGADCEVTLLSDHGSGGASDKVLYLNRVLAEQGLLHFKPVRRWQPATLKELALRKLSPRLRERVFRLGGSFLPGRLESSLRFGGIDMKHTVAFSDELNYFPAIHLNIRGREPKGIVRAQDRRETILRVQAALRDIRHPETGRRVFAKILPREELFDGPYVERAPDLLLDLHLDDDYSYNLMPSASAPPGSGQWRRLGDNEKLGKKGRSLPGSHRSHGFMALRGPRIRPVGRIDAHIADLTATLLARLDVAVPTSFRGRVLWEALESSGEAHPLPAVEPRPSGRNQDEATVEARLRALGYVE